MKSFNNTLFFSFYMEDTGLDEIEIGETKKTLEKLAENRIFSPTESDKQFTDRHAEDFINSFYAFGLSDKQAEILKNYYEEAKTKAIEASI